MLDRDLLSSHDTSRLCSLALLSSSLLSDTTPRQVQKIFTEIEKATEKLLKEATQYGEVGSYRTHWIQASCLRFHGATSDLLNHRLVLPVHADNSKSWKTLFHRYGALLSYSFWLSRTEHLQIPRREPDDSSTSNFSVRRSTPHRRDVFRS